MVPNARNILNHIFFMSFAVNLGICGLILGGLSTMNQSKHQHTYSPPATDMRQTQERCHSQGQPQQNPSATPKEPNANFLTERRSWKQETSGRCLEALSQTKPPSLQIWDQNLERDKGVKIPRISREEQRRPCETWGGKVLTRFGTQNPCFLCSDKTQGLLSANDLLCSGGWKSPHDKVWTAVPEFSQHRNGTPVLHSEAQQAETATTSWRKFTTNCVPVSGCSHPWGLWVLDLPVVLETWGQGSVLVQGRPEITGYRRSLNTFTPDLRWSLWSRWISEPLAGCGRLRPSLTIYLLASAYLSLNFLQNNRGKGRRHGEDELTKQDTRQDTILQEAARKSCPHRGWSRTWSRGAQPTWGSNFLT